MPDHDSDTGLALAARRAPAESEERWLRCVRCDHRVTPAVARIEVGGFHEHFQANPVGITFLFGCFGEAPGSRLAGEPTAEHTWFPGHQWRHALCANCAEHLGWYFRSATGGGFYGLVLNRLASG